jgi:hypothetical protein
MRARTRRLCLGVAGLFIAFSSTLFAGFSGTEVFIPAVGRVTGAGGSEFYTTVWITNLSTTASVSFQFQFLRSGQANTAPASFSDTLAVGQTKIYENIVESRFGLTGVNGAGRIVANGEVYVSSRIYEQPPGTDLGSSKGLFFSGVPASFGLGIGDRASLQGVNQGGTQNLRYNFILLEIGGQPTTVHVDLKDANGAALAGKDYTLQAFEHRQVNVTDVLPSISTTNARLESIVTSGAGRVLFAGAQVTNVSQDPTGFEMSFKGSLLGGNGAAGVLSLNGLIGNVTLVGGTNVTVTPSGNTLTIAAIGGAAAGVSSLNALTGNVALEAGTDITITTVGNSLRIAHTNGAVPNPPWLLTGNNISPGQFLGSVNDQAVDIRVNNQRALRLEPGGDTPNVIAGGASNFVSARVGGGAVGGGGDCGAGPNRVTDNFATVGGGCANQAGDNAGNAADRNYATVAGGQSNLAAGLASTVGGGGGNSATAEAATVAGGIGNLASGGGAAVSGGIFNTAGGVVSAIAGGTENTASGDHAAIGGGKENQASGLRSTIAGGDSNTATGLVSAIAGGASNTASLQGAAVGGGTGNTASGISAAVAGGQSNTASGASSAIPGGANNTATGVAGLAAGFKARANHDGAFVWGDFTDVDISSTGTNQFIVRANGGARFLRGMTTHHGTFATLQAEQGGTSGEAAWLYTPASNNSSTVINLLKHPAGANNFLNCTNYDGVSAIGKCHIDANGTMVSGSDFAEALPAMGKRKGYEPGDVIVASSEKEGHVERSSRRYDSRVIGVYSTRPGVLGADKDGETRVDAEDVPVAITGIVPTKVTAENGPIFAGDLLTTSSTPGHAMKATPVVVGGVEIYRAGTVLGKALTSLHGETGVVKVLVMMR